MEKERTLVFIKPDGIERNLTGKIISRLEDEGLKIIKIKTVEVDKELADKHYTNSDEQVIGMGKKTLSVGEDEARKLFGTVDPKEIGMQLREWLIEGVMSSPVIAIVLESDNAVQKVRDLVGFTDPIRAEKGTLRRDLGEDSIAKANKERRATQNLVHASSSIEEAKQEINLWFGSN